MRKQQGSFGNGSGEGFFGPLNGAQASRSATQTRMNTGYMKSTPRNPMTASGTPAGDGQHGTPVDPNAERNVSTGTQERTGTGYLHSSQNPVVDRGRGGDGMDGVAASSLNPRVNNNRTGTGTYHDPQPFNPPTRDVLTTPLSGTRLRAISPDAG